MSRVRGPAHREHAQGPFAVNLRLALEIRRISSAWLASRLEMCPRRVRRLADGTNDPDYAEIPRFARALRVPPRALAWEEDAASFRALVEAGATRPRSVAARADDRRWGLFGASS